MSSEELEGIVPIEADAEPTEPETTQPEAEPKTTKELAREKLTAKLEQGIDLSNKEEKARICHEIANEIQNKIGSCSYQAVAKEVPFVLKAKKEIKTEPEMKTVEGNTIIKKGVNKLDRPAKKIIDETNTTEEKPILTPEQLALIQMKFNSNGPETFEETTIKFALEDVGFFISSLGLPKPQMKMLKQRAKQIAQYNELQRAKGNDENVIEIGDRLLKYAIYFGVASTFFQPIVSKYFPSGKIGTKNNTGIETKSESLI